MIPQLLKHKNLFQNDTDSPPWRYRQGCGSFIGKLAYDKCPYEIGSILGMFDLASKKSVWILLKGSQASFSTEINSLPLINSRWISLRIIDLAAANCDNLGWIVIGHSVLHFVALIVKDRIKS
jgi:hypothetical protein